MSKGWEYVDSRDEVERLEVPGGWLYWVERTSCHEGDYGQKVWHTYNPLVVFVPRPLEVSE